MRICIIPNLSVGGRNCSTMKKYLFGLSTGALAALATNEPYVQIGGLPMASPVGGNFIPLPPPIQCDDMRVTNGTSCIYLVSNASKLVAPLELGPNVSMPNNFVVKPPQMITEGGWFSFNTLIDWSNATNPIITPWSGVVQYFSKDLSGNTYIFQIVFNFGAGEIDIGFDFPQFHGIDAAPEVQYDPQWFTGFQIVDNKP